MIEQLTLWLILLMLLWWLMLETGWLSIRLARPTPFNLMELVAGMTGIIVYMTIIPVLLEKKIKDDCDFIEGMFKEGSVCIWWKEVLSYLQPQRRC